LPRACAMLARLTCAKALRPALGASRRMLSTELPLEPPIPMFGTAGRYATALYTAAAKKGALIEVEADLKLFKETVSMSSTLQHFVADPSVSRASKVTGITSLMDSAKASETTKNAMAALAEGGRLGDVVKVIDLYSELLTAAKGEVSAVITSAKPLKPDEVKKITDSLGQFMEGNKKMITTLKVDPALINGITVELGDKYLDMSVATQLKKLQALLSDGL